MMRALGDLILIKVETSGVQKAGEGVWMKTEAGRIFRSIPGGKIHRWYKADSSGSIKLTILQMAAKMSREVAEACERINWAGVEEVRVSFFSRERAFLQAFLLNPFCFFGWWRLFLRIQSRIHLSGGGCSATLDPSGRHPE